ncbi:unnamed protein product [Cuscuta campestris]|uniref:DUF659 domain-containing protein n=1 Tax=Cuscuta campestris TaxID=132261 RepID=A0A484LXW6_9ASTE|nr:unnamed protein product [Cuscuta campestris]
MKKRLSSIEGRVAITTDMWSAKNQKKGYMAVTGHFIDNDWKLEHHILRFIYVLAPHTSETLARVFFLIPVGKPPSMVGYCKIPETKRLIVDSKTRSNSTYEMLEIALLYKDAFYRLRQSLKNEKFVLPDENTCKDNALRCSSIFVDEDVQEEKINEEDGDVESDEDDI